MYRQRGNRVKIEGGSVKEVWKNLKKKIKKCETTRKVRIRKKRLGEHSWWDAECKRRKRNAYKAYRKWRKGKQGKEEYLRFRRELREICKKKEEKNRKKLEEEIKNIKTEEQVWRFVNPGRRKTRIVEEDIRTGRGIFWNYWRGRREQTERQEKREEERRT